MSTSSHENVPLPSPEATPDPSWLSRIRASLALSDLLRLAGGGLVVAAVIQFMMLRWEAGDDLFRYGLLLGQTGLLTALGFFTARLLRETKSARLFLGLGLVSAAAVFTILGALLYSLTPWDLMAANYPGYAHWQLDTGIQLAYLVPGSLVVLLPVALLAFAVLARGLVRPLTALFMVNGSLLLIPLRDPALISPLVLVMGVVSMVLFARWATTHRVLVTQEGMAARVLVVTPLLILAARSLMLYDAGTISAASLSLLAYLLMRRIAAVLPAGKPMRYLVEWGAVGPLMIAAVALSWLLADRMPGDIESAAFGLALGLAMLLGFMDLARSSVDSVSGFRRLAGGLPLLPVTLLMLVDAGIGTALSCVLVSTISFVVNRVHGQRILMVASLAGLLSGIAYLITLAVQASDLGAWMGLGLLGIVAILAAAAVERHGERLRAMLLGR